MVGPSGTLGDEDYEALSVKPGCSEGQLEPGQTGHYTITGLSALFPQTIIFGTAGAGCNGPEAGVKQDGDAQPRHRGEPRCGMTRCRRQVPGLSHRSIRSVPMKNNTLTRMTKQIAA